MTLPCSKQLTCMLLVFSTSVWSQETDSKATDAPAAVTSPSPTLTPAATLPQAKPFVTSAFAYGARRAWFNGTRLLGGGLYYQGGLVQGLGGYVRADGMAPVTMSGVRLVERHGFISTALVKVVGFALVLVGVVGAANANSTTTYEGYYTDGGRTFVVERETISVNSTQAAAFQSDVAALENTVDSIGPGQVEATNDFGSGLWADFTLFDPHLALLNRDAPGATGYDLSFGTDFRVATLFGLPLVLDVGLAMASIRAPRTNSSLQKTYLYDCFGLMARLHVPLSKFVTFSIDWTLNFYALGYLTAPDALIADGRVVSMPLRANLELHLTDRFFARGSAVLGGLGFSDGKLGVGLDVGVRL